MAEENKYYSFNKIKELQNKMFIIEGAPVMTEEENKQPATVEQNYLDAINELKKNSVDKAEYDKLLEENKKLLNTIVYTKPVEDKPAEPTKMSKDEIDGLRKELYDSDIELSNLEYIDKTLKLRKAIMDNGGIDPFVPNGTRIKPTAEDEAAAERVANALQHCVDYANENGGDSEVFTNELNRITVDIPLPRRKNY